MNWKITAVTFLFLVVIVLVYPPFYWSTKDAAVETIVQSQLPLKERAMIFGPSSRKFQLKHFPANKATKDTPQTNADLQEQLKEYSDEELERIVGIMSLQRSLAWPDLGVEIIIAFVISLLTGVIVAKKKRMDG